jgi:hypothetical protein
MAGWDLGRLRGAAGVWLAALALVLQIVVPPGFMAARTASGAPAVVICTGHGPLKGLDDTPAKPERGGDHLCVFAGHAAAPPPPTSLALTETRVERVEAPVLVARDLQPGRGLAAPPPPSRGPPALSI